MGKRFKIAATLTSAGFLLLLRIYYNHLRSRASAGLDVRSITTFIGPLGDATRRLA